MVKLYEDTNPKLRLRLYQDETALKTFLEKSLRQKSIMYIIGKKENFENNLGDYWKFYLKRCGQLNINPKFKDYAGQITLLVWANKVGFVQFGDDFQIFGFKNPEVHDLYQKLWNNF
jgi:hypothetical protein